jgi:hypothetical protein
MSIVLVRMTKWVTWHLCQRNLTLVTGESLKKIKEITLILGGSRGSRLWQLACLSVQREVVMELLMLIGFVGAVITLAFLSCATGNTTEGQHIRSARGEFEDWRWCARR